MGLEKTLRQRRVDSAACSDVQGATKASRSGVSAAGDRKKREAGEAHDDALAAYISAIGRIPLLSAEQESAAAIEIQRTEEMCWEHLLLNQTCRGYLGQRIHEQGEWKIEERLRALCDLSKSKSRAKSASLSLRNEIACALRILDEEKKLLRQAFEHVAHERGGTGQAKFLSKAKSLMREAQRRRDSFVTSNLRLVVSVAKKFHHHRLSLNDLIQEGNIGLLKSVQRFDPHKGFRFSTYAHWWIRQAIERSIMNKGCQIRLPVHVYEQRRELAKAKHELEQNLGREPNATELSDALGVPLARVVDLMQTVPSEPQSLDEPFGDDEGRLLMETILDPHYVAVDEMVSCVDDARSVCDALATLSPMERDIINRRFGLSLGADETLEEIGRSYRLSRERVRQIQVKGLRKIADFCADPSALVL